MPVPVAIVPSITRGKIDRAFLVPNPRIDGFRAFIDVTGEPGQLAEMRAFLKSGNKTLTETWSYPWRAEAKEPPAAVPQSQPAAAQQPAPAPAKE